MKKRRKKTKRQKLKDELEKLVKEYIKKRDNNICQKCGKKVELQNCHASHVIPASRDWRLAFNDINLKVLCYYDHINWWHKHPIEAWKWFVDKFPDRRKYLQKKHLENQKKSWIKEFWYEEKIEHYKKLLSTKKN